jgi:SAM-dependent methyltransferase
MGRVGSRLMTEPGLTPERAARVYDRIGRLQDWQRLYEGPAIADLLASADFEHAEAVFELGCGTGGLAARLLTDHLPPSASYVGVDVSAKMIQLAAPRLQRFGDRARVRRIDGNPPLPAPSATFDRFVAVYVFDLLAEPLARALLDEAKRLLRPSGRLCLVSLTHGTTVPSRLLCSLWDRASRLAPAMVGGCRPIDLMGLLEGWQIEHAETTVAWAVASQIVVAAPAPR